MRQIDAPKKDRLEGIDPGTAPILQWIAITDLVVDDDYQRDLKPGNRKAIRRIAEAFKWSRFSPVFVAPVAGGKFAIIDGQHRTHAAALCGITEVPCQIVQMTREEQAASFAAVNGLVTKVTTWQIYKAALAAGEEWACKVNAAAADAGCKVMTNNASSYDKKPGHIYAVNLMREMVESYGQQRVTKALSILMRAQGICDDPLAWDSLILRAMISALCHRAPAMERKEIVGVIEGIDIHGALDRYSQLNKDRMRRGLSYTPKRQQLEEKIIATIDQQLPARMALPSAAE